MDVDVYTPPAVPKLQAVRILLADDSALERLAMGHFLRGSGYEVDEVDDGRSTIEYLKHRQVDLLLLDLHMPELDGFGVLAYLQDNRPGLPVILMSGLEPGEIQSHIRHLPRPELPPLVLKPVNLEQVLDIIELQMSGAMPNSADSTDIAVRATGS